MREPFGVKVAKSGKVTAKWIKNLTLYDILKSYDPNLSENESRLLVRYLNIDSDNDERIDYKDFTTKAFKLFEKMELRDRQLLQLFFSSIPMTSTGAVDEIPSAPIGNLVKDLGVNTGENSSPVRLAGAMEAALVDCILRIKQKFKILTTKDAEMAFRRINLDNNKSISKAEFNNMTRQVLPEITDKTNDQLYRWFDKNNVGGFTFEQFTDVVLKKVTDHLDRIELLFEKTEPFIQTIKEINTKLDLSRKRISEVFPGNPSSIKRQMAVDYIKKNLKVNDPLDKMSQMFEIMEVEQAGAKVVLIEELQEILAHHRPKKDTIVNLFESEIVSPSSPTKNRKFNDFNSPRIDQVIENIRAYIRENPEKTIYTLFNKLDKDHNQLVEFQEFYILLRAFYKNISETEAKMVFKRVDINRSDVITLNEFIEYFGMREYLNRSEVMDTVKRRDTRFDQIVGDINKALSEKKMTPEKLLSRSGELLSKKNFDQFMQTFRIDPKNYHNYPEFIRAIEHKRNTDSVDMNKLVLLLDQYYSQNKEVLTKDMSSKAEMFLYDLLRIFNSDIDVILAVYDPDKNGIISLAEFSIMTRKYLGSQSPTQPELEAIYKALIGDDKDLSRFVLQLKLIDIQTKYNQGSTSFMTSQGDNSFNMVGNPSPRGLVSPSRGNLFEFDRVLGGDQSTPGLLLPTVELSKLSPEEKHRHDIEDVYLKVRVEINHQDELLVQELRHIDSNGDNILHEDYIWQALKKLGAMPTEFSDAEKKLLFEEVAMHDGMYYYLDFVRRLFPSKQMANIKDADGLVAELIQQQQLKRETMADLLAEVYGKDDKNYPELTPVQFRKLLSKRGLLLSDDVFEKVFSGFDTKKRRKINIEEFKAQFNKGPVNAELKLIKDLKDFLKANNKTSEAAFSEYVPKSKEFEFKDFANALQKMNYEIKYFDIERLFNKIDSYGDKNGKLSLKELAAKLDEVIPAKVETIDSTLIRKNMYKHVKAKYHGFKSFWDTFDPSNKGYITLEEFGEMLKSIEIVFKDLLKDVKPMYQAINCLDMNFRLSFKELELFYDEKSILNLFPVITQFRTAFLNFMTAEMKPAYYIIRAYCKKGQELDLEEFKGLLEGINLKVDKEQAELIFNELDYSGDKQVSPSELRRLIANEIIDVVGLTDRICTTLYRKNIDARTAFMKVNKNNDDGLNFAEFYDLMVKQMNLNMTIIEVEELFEFAGTKGNSKVSLADFVNLFGSTKKVNPLLHNQKYMTSLPPETADYYKQKYRSAMGPSRNLLAYDKTADTEAMDLRRRPLQRKDKNFGLFNLEKVDSGENAMKPAMPPLLIPSLPLAPHDQPVLEFTENDLKFGSRIRTKGYEKKLPMAFKEWITDNKTNLMSFDDLKKMIKELANLSFSEPEVKAIFDRMHSFGVDPPFKISAITFEKYMEAVLKAIDKSKENGVNLRSVAGPALKKVMVNERCLPEDHFRKYKARKGDCMLINEFTKLINDLHLIIEPTAEDINKLFVFLNREKDDGMLTFLQFMQIFDDPHEVTEHILKQRYSSLLFQVKVEL